MVASEIDLLKPADGNQVAVVDEVDRLAPPGLNKNNAEHISESREVKASSKSSGRERMEASYVGWKQIGRWEESDTLTVEDELVGVNEETFLDNVVPDKFYGDWYHATATFFIGGFLSFLCGKFKFSLAPIFIIVFVTAVFYRTSTKKYRASIRELVQKEFTVQKVEDDYESMEWLNTFLDKFWPILEPSVSQMVVQQVNDQLATHPKIPPFIKALWIDSLTLGVKPPRIDLVKTAHNTDMDVVVMDYGLSFTPHDLSDMTSKQLTNYINQRVVVKAKLFGLTIPVYLSNISFKSHVRIRLKLMTPFPHCEMVNIQLLEVPDVDFVFKLFGDTIFNWEIMSVPGLLPLVRQLATKYMGPLFLPPFSLQLNIPQLLSASALSIGVLEVMVDNAKNLRKSTALKPSVDPYLEFSFAGKVVGKTKTVADSLSPVWNESLFLLLGSFTTPLTITAYDRREKLKDKVLGRIQYNLTSLHSMHLQKNLRAKFLRNSKPVGELSFSLVFHPTIEEKKLPDGTIEEIPELNTGITKIVVEQAKDLDEPGKNIAAFVELYINSKLVLTTKTVKSSDTHEWGTDFESVITDRRKTRAKLIVKNGKGEILSTTVQTLNDLIDRTQIDNKWIPLKNGKSSLKITTHWKPVSLDIGSNAVAYTPPIGVVRVFLNKAHGLKNLEKFGTIDPYAEVLVNGIMKGRTAPKESTLNPVWNEAIYVAVTSPNQKITIEVMDVEYASADRSLGKFDVMITDMCKKGPDDKYVPHVDEQPKSGKLVHRKGIRGTVTYYTSFYPTVPVLSLEEIQEVDDISERKAQLEVKNSQCDKKTTSSEAIVKLKEEKEELKELEDMFSSKMKLDLDELVQYHSGVLSVTILSGELPQPGCYIQAFFDSNGYARFATQKKAVRSFRDSTIGDVIIKELDWSVTTFRVVKNRDANKAEDALCEVTIPTIELVNNCYHKPAILAMSGTSSGKLMVQVSWFPLLVNKLPRSDLITNCGDLKIYIKSANGLAAADRNGKSDPFLKFFLNANTQPFYKTKVQKKTLDPTWDENCVIQISNRVNEYLKIKVMDWDVGNKDDKIGEAMVSLAKIDPDADNDMDIPVKGTDGSDAGVLHLAFEFQPRYVLSVTKKETRIGDLAGKGLTAGLNAGTTVIGGGLGAVGKIKKGIFGGGKKKEEEIPEY